MRFQTISQFFSVDGSGLSVGQAVASKEAIYFVTALEPFNLTSLLKGRITTRLSGDSGPFQTRLAELPVTVTEDSEWPIKTKEGFVCVFDRQSISEIRCSLTGTFRVTHAKHSAIIKTGVIKRFRILRILREFGWNV